ncbi:hypothetical protein TPB0596_00220 [Tsukamurella pulmonis]|nr:hypothetical protein TPB0596_00220 [Tsukamurella pulmonis]
MNRMTRAAAALSAAAVMGVVSACGGGGDDASTMNAAGKYTREQACTVALGQGAAIAGVANAITYNYKNTSLPGDIGTLQYLDRSDATQAALEKDWVALRDNGAAAQKALSDGNTAEAQRLIDASKAPYDRVIEACADSGSPSIDTARELRAQLDGKAAPSSTTPSAPSIPVVPSSAPAAPFVPTPDGTRLKVGEAAQVEFGAKDKSPRRFRIRVTGVEKAPAEDLKKFRADALKDKGEVHYLRYEIESTDKISGTYDAKATAASDLDPRFALATSDGSNALGLTALGSFAPCKNGSELGYAGMARKNCQLYTVKGENSRITEVGLLSLEFTADSTARFTWVV